MTDRDSKSISLTVLEAHHRQLPGLNCVMKAAVPPYHGMSIHLWTDVY